MENEIVSELRKNNPYPEDVFIPLSKEKIKEYVKCLTENGYSSDSIHGNWGRAVWDNCCDKLEKIIANK